MATISSTLRDQPEHLWCGGCEQRVNVDLHDIDECRRQYDPEYAADRARDIAEDMAFEAHREDRLLGRERW